MDMNNTQMTVLTEADEFNMLVDRSSATMSYCSVKATTNEEKVALFNAINNPEKRLKEMVNVPIALKDVYCERVTFIDKGTGEAQPGVRMVLIAEDGTAYQAASKGVFSSLDKLFKVFGYPNTWDKPISIIPKVIDRGTNRQVLVFSLS